MTLPIFPQQAVDMLGAVNGRPYDAKTNPRGLANGGHRQVFPDSLQAMVEGLTYTQQVALALEVLARLVETSATDAKAAKDESIRIQGDTETFAIRALAAVEKVEGAASMQMSDAGKQFVGLGTYDAMFQAIMRPAANTKRGVVFVANQEEAMDITNDRDVLTPATLDYVLTKRLTERLKGLGAMDYSRTGWVRTNVFETGSGEEAKYIDIPITRVYDYNKCKPEFIGGFCTNTGDLVAPMIENYSNGVGMTLKVTAKLTSNINLRLCVSYATGGYIAGRWTVGAPS